MRSISLACLSLSRCSASHCSSESLRVRTLLAAGGGGGCCKLDVPCRENLSNSASRGPLNSASWRPFNSDSRGPFPSEDWVILPGSFVKGSEGGISKLKASELSI